MLAITAGKHFIYKQSVMLQTNPVVQALVALADYFKSLSKVSNMNLATELGDILKLPTDSSLHVVTTQLKKLFDLIVLL